MKRTLFVVLTILLAASNANAFRCDGDELQVTTTALGNAVSLSGTRLEVYCRPGDVAAIEVSGDRVGTGAELALKAALSTALMAVAMGDQIEVEIRPSAQGFRIRLVQ